MAAPPISAGGTRIRARIFSHRLQHTHRFGGDFNRYRHRPAPLYAPSSAQPAPQFFVLIDGRALVQQVAKFVDAMMRQ
jgi:hypothetical protein